MAWLHATPKPEKEIKGAPPPVSRIDKLRADGVTPAMPPNPAPHIIARLIELGITESTGMGPVPISWREMAEWQRLTGVSLDPWEARLLRQLSVAYIAESRKAESDTCPAPWRREVTQAERDADERRLRMVLG